MNKSGERSDSVTSAPNLPGGRAGAADEAHALMEQIALSRAAELARAGRYREAEDLLESGSSSDDPSPVRLDLLARICAQQGRYREARAHWEKAAQREPVGEGCAAGLRRLTQRERLPAWWPRTRTPAYIVALLLISGLVGFAVLDFEGRARFPIEIAPGAPGVTVAHARGKSVVRFDSGLFSRGTEFVPETKELLTTVGKRLEAFNGGLSIEITGHTNDLPVPPGGAYGDNYALGLARAVAVVDHLRATTKLPHEAYRVRSLGAEHAPYPNDTRTDRARNKSVTITVRPLER